MKYSYSRQSWKNLNTCDPRLVVIFIRAANYMDLTILHGHRNETEQNLMVRSGWSVVPWPNSKHNSLPAKAVDAAPYPINWTDTGRFYQMASLVLEIALDLGHSLRWGGNWPIKNVSETFDGPHFYLLD